LLLNTRGKKYVFASGIYPLNIIYLSRNWRWSILVSLAETFENSPHPNDGIC
jgi:hypothetical protein